MSEEIYAIAAEACALASGERDPRFLYNDEGVYRFKPGVFDFNRHTSFKCIIGKPIHFSKYNSTENGWLESLRWGQNRVNDRFESVHVKGMLLFPKGIKNPINVEVA